MNYRLMARLSNIRIKENTFFWHLALRWNETLARNKQQEQNNTQRTISSQVDSIPSTSNWFCLFKFNLATHQFNQSWYWSWRWCKRWKSPHIHISFEMCPFSRQQQGYSMNNAMTHPLKTTNNLQNLLTQRNQLVIYISINYNDSDYQPHMNLFFFF